MTQTLTSDSENGSTAGTACDICLYLEQILNGSIVEKTYDNTLLNPLKCTDHNALLDYIRTHFSSRQRKQKLAGLIERDDQRWGWVFGREHGGTPWVTGLDIARPELQRYQLLHQPRDIHSEKMNSMCISTIHPSWIDLQVARKWLHKCVTEHASKCKRPPGLKHVSPAWLIDTKDDRLVPGDGIVDFVALSYRWGSNKHQKMELAIFERMVSPEGLAVARHAGLLTPTVKHAIQTVREIGERYLWIDAICLASDNKEMMIEQLQLMGAIYASAKLAIVALEGDSTTGLAGTPDLPRVLNNSLKWKNGSRILVRNPPALSVTDVDASEYFKRGWTFQEYTLSQRRLIFANQQIHWTCSSCYWHEDLPDVDEGLDMTGYLSRRLGVAKHTQFRNILAGFPDIKELNNLINEYNNRELSYTEDAFPGIVGLLNYVGIAFRGGFLFGLPKASFDAALMWGCFFKDGEEFKLQRLGLHRRKSSGSGDSILPNAALPSWSWIGWKGSNIDILQDETKYLLTELQLAKSRDKPVPRIMAVPKLSCSAAITIPITQWFGHKSIDWDIKEPITPSLKDPYVAPASFDATIWRRTKFDPNLHSPRKGAIPPWGITGEYVYEHVDFPGQFYWQPPPDHQIMREHESPNYLESQYISCPTQRLQLAAVLQMEDACGVEVKIRTQLRLCNKHGKVCGWLQIQDENDLAEFKAAGNFKRSSSTDPFLTRDERSQVMRSNREHVLELVAVCLRKFPVRDYEGTLLLTYRDFYGVLWVKWVDGIAYRHGCGYVKKEMWDEQEPEDINLILG
ncbi:hypothetical protein E8E13_001516 [Curvularia kusanoi]|uniref:Heterokaryon incompatibility domain-containing protein n=1 Tax=Curvularia kusanoi TaxID=90978 RepID=A0A9P4T914_CURKU|nr:hypothetical protein E8E13_001516 [Curvularia kusanoi]